MNADRTLLDDALRVQNDLAALRRYLEALPDELRGRAQLVLGRIEQDMRRRRQLLLSFQDALGQMRLDMKYLAFDLEATRRERDAFREQLGTDFLEDMGPDARPLDDHGTHDTGSDDPEGDHWGGDDPHGDHPI